MEHEICIQCGAEVRPEEAYHVAEEAVCPSCAETDTVVCSYCGERIWRENDFGDSDTALCEACYTNHYTRCNQCGRLISFSAAYYQDEDEDEETPYCSACYHECGEAIHCYSYKPVPIFHGDAPMYMGVELEVDDGGKDPAKAKKILSIFNQTGEFGYIKSDGSLDDGLELVTHPCTLEAHMREVPWREA